MMRKLYIPYILFCVAVLALPIVIRNSHDLGIMIQAGFFCLITMGLSLLMGYAGQISLGHAAFFGMGAYASAILTGTYGWSPWTALVAGIILSGLVAFLVGIPSLKLKGHYLAMATLGFGEIVRIFIDAEMELTGGPSGYQKIIPYMQFGKWTMNSEVRHYYLTWIMVLIVLVFNLHIINSRIGRALRSIHADEEAARSVGVNVSRFKLMIFVLSAVYASLAGSLYCHNILFVAPGPFSPMESIRFVTMVIIGGMGSIWGAISGALLLTWLPEVLRHFKDFNILVYGGLLLFVMLFIPGGLFEAGRKVISLVRRIVHRAPAEEVHE